jgi:hypothetical protein
MPSILHVDEVDNDDSTQIAQAHLTCDRLRSFQIGFEDRVVKTAAAHRATRIDIDRRQRLGWINDQVTPRLQCDLGLECAADLLFDAVQVKNRAIAQMLAEFARQRGHVVIGKGLQRCKRFGLVD